MRTPVPGLYRGVQVWRRLCEVGEASLDQLAVQTGYPKASVLRMLKTLCDLELAERSGRTGLCRACAHVIFSNAGAARSMPAGISKITVPGLKTADAESMSLSLRNGILANSNNHCEFVRATFAGQKHPRNFLGVGIIRTPSGYRAEFFFAAFFNFFLPSLCSAGMAGCWSRTFCSVIRADAAAAFVAPASTGIS